jgi:hypothetical protein
MQPENKSTQSYGVAVRTRIIGVCGVVCGAMLLYIQTRGFSTGSLCLDLPLSLIAVFFMFAGVVFLFYQARLTIGDSGVTYSFFSRKREVPWGEIDHAALDTTKNPGLKNERLMLFRKTDKIRASIDVNIALLNSRKEIVEQLRRHLGSTLREG